MAEARTFLADVVADDWFARRWPDVLTPTLERRGHGARWSLALPATGHGPDVVAGHVLAADLTVPTVLHELAHLCRGPSGGHDDRFVAALLALVRRHMGAHAYGALLAAVTATQRWPFLPDELGVLAP